MEYPLNRVLPRLSARKNKIFKNKSNGDSWLDIELLIQAMFAIELLIQAMFAIMFLR